MLIAGPGVNIFLVNEKLGVRDLFGSALFRKTIVRILSLALLVRAATSTDVKDAKLLYLDFA